MHNSLLLLREKKVENGVSVNFWGTVTDVWNPEKVDLPPESNKNVQRLASAMLVFFIVAIILLVKYYILSGILV